MSALTRRAMLAELAAAAALQPKRAFAAWPERNISLIHGLTAGGGVDVSARVIAEGLSRSGQAAKAGSGRSTTAAAVPPSMLPSRLRRVSAAMRFLPGF